MTRPANPPEDPGRRRVLAAFVNTLVAVLSGAFSALLGVFALRPASRADNDRWIKAASLGDLTPDLPVPRVLAVPRPDGWYRARARETVFVVWNGDRDVRAFSATCTHLGCQVVWDAAGKRFRCPCHGGAYDAKGQVLEGPPPRPLQALDARIDTANETVLVRM